MQSTFFSRFQDWLAEWNQGKTRQLLVVLLAVLLGLLIGMVTYTIAKSVLYMIAPPYPTTDYSENPVLLETDPFGSYWVIVVSWTFGTLAGAYCAVRWAKVGQFPAWLAGVLLTAFFLIDLIARPNTMLIFLICPALVALCAWGGGWLGMYVNVQKQYRADAQGAEPVAVAAVEEPISE
jgi:hypothetical protein